MVKILELPFIERELDHVSVSQRVTDGFIDATGICTAAGKSFADYARLKPTGEFLTALSSDMGIPILKLIQQVRGGLPENQGTWVHPQVAINLSQWASPKFAVLVSKWVFEWMSGSTSRNSRLPYHLKRYMINRSAVPAGHFSVFNEIIIGLIAPLEELGYELPDKLVPDISQGKMFANWIRKEKGLEPNDFPSYSHTYPDGRKIPNVIAYPNYLIAEFRQHFTDVWLRERATDYFKCRDPKSLPYLAKVVRNLPEPVKAIEA